MYSCKFTVFTPTFNREKLLVNLYDSLKRQTFKNFEWLIVDDGSTDNTESLVKGWIKEKFVQIRYIKQKNQGKFIAINTGVQEALGELFLITDSDDYCEDNALEKFLFCWKNIPANKKTEFTGVMALCVDKNNQIIGDEFPTDIFDYSWIDLRFKFNIKGDKWGFYKTEILKEYPFPVIDNEKFLTEGLIWNRIGLKYKIRFINEKLLVVNYQKDGYSSHSLKLRMIYPLGAILYYKEFLSLPVNFIWKMRNFINYLRFSFHAKKNIFLQINIINNFWLKLISPIILFISYLFYIIDTTKIKFFKQ